MVYAFPLALDHHDLIQTALACVMVAMQSGIAQTEPRTLWPPGLRRRCAAGGYAPQRGQPMGASDADDPWAASIAAIAARQERGAFAALFGHFAPRVKSYLLKHGVSDTLAEEIAQETLLAVWRKAPLYDPGVASAATWIFTIARNLRIDAGRRERRRFGIRVSEVEAEFLADEAALPDARAAASQSNARVRAAMQSLSAEQLSVVRMSFFEDVAHGEIARTLEIPVGTVKSRLRLAMVRLRGLMEKE